MVGDIITVVFRHRSAYASIRWLTAQSHNICHIVGRLAPCLNEQESQSMLTANAVHWVTLTLSPRRSDFVMSFDDPKVLLMAGWLLTSLLTLHDGICFCSVLWAPREARSAKLWPTTASAPTDRSWVHPFAHLWPLVDSITFWAISDWCLVDYVESADRELVCGGVQLWLISRLFVKDSCSFALTTSKRVQRGGYHNW